MMIECSLFDGDGDEDYVFAVFLPYPPVVGDRIRSSDFELIITSRTWLASRKSMDGYTAGRRCLRLYVEKVER